MPPAHLEAMTDRPYQEPNPTTERLDNACQLRAEQGYLVVVQGLKAGGRTRLPPGGLVIGSGDRTDLQLGDRGVSKRHVEIRVVDGRPVLKDLGSTNGTQVNSTAVREAYLAPGDLISLGTCQLRFETREEVVSVPPSAAERFGQLYGRSLAMRQLFGFLERVAATEVTVLVQGETGTGKELVARALHDASPRAKRPFVVFDCSSVSPELVASELFGHKEGAFTGATRNRQGNFEAASGGTLFLDEVGELPLDIQPHLLRALEAREVRPVGSSTSLPVNVRVIAATHRDLLAMVAQKTFREDLYYRLAVLLVKAPPLRQRREDIPGLARILLDRGTGASRSLDISPEALAILTGQSWPGNVRELRNVLERSAALSTGTSLQAGDLLLSHHPVSPRGSSLEIEDRTLEEIEKEVILQTLEKTQGNKLEAARRLGIHRSTLYDKLRKYGLAGEE